MEVSRPSEVARYLEINYYTEVQYFSVKNLASSHYQIATEMKNNKNILSIKKGVGHIKIGWPGMQK